MEFDTGELPKRHLLSEPQASQASAIRLVTGHAGDHMLVYTLLRAANHAPSYEEFLAWIDEPTYEPTDRLLVKFGSRIIAHVQVLDRVAWFHGVKLPVGGVEGLATLPEYRDAGYERLLVSAAEQAMRDSQAVVAFARTDRLDLYRAGGWSEVGCPRYTEANVNDVLARLASSPSASATLARRARPLKIRLWRQVELDALLAVDRHTAAATWGGLERSEAYWRWLVGRKVHDELIVAIHGRDDWEELDTPAHIVGYAMTRGSQVIELATLPTFCRAAEPLLARACQDAIEHDHRSISLHIPATDRLHELMLSASGSWSTSGRRGNTLFVKLLDPARWIENMYEVLLERAKAAGLTRPLTIIFDTGQRKYRLELTRRSGHLIREDAATADVTCTPEMLGALLLGNVDVPAAQRSGQMAVRDEMVETCLAALFPLTTFWQSQFDLPRC
jgi:predicted acetyltransferase